jgi:predicted phosphate transport protein (TIGR00153 family)
MRLALVPRTSEFYELFTEAGANALAAARKAHALFRDYPSGVITQGDIKELEHVGDRLTADIVQLLNTHYVTPFDREDIYQLATELDNIVDHIEHACQLLDIYSVESSSRQAIDLSRCLVGAMERLAVALAELKGRRGAQTAAAEVKHFEDEADRVYRDAVAALFHDSRIDPLVVIRWKDIYEAIEEAIDASERTANVVGNIVVKNA